MTERENILKVFRGELPQWLPNYTEATHYLFSDYTDIEKPQTKEGYDWFGVHWIPVEATNGMTHPDPHQAPIIDDISEWEDQVTFPDIETAVDWDTVGAQLNAQCDEFCKDKLMVIMLEHGIFERLTLLAGFEDALTAPYDDMEAAQAYGEALVDFKLLLIDKLLEVCPRIDMFDWHDDLGTQNGAMMAPEVWDEAYGAAMERAGKYVHDRGKLFMYHSCGKIDQIMGSVMDRVRPDGWNVLQTCNDQEYIKRTFGRRVVLVCGLNTQDYIDVASPVEADVREEVDRSIHVLAPGGRFCAGMYLRGCFCGEGGVDPLDVIDDEVARVGKDYYTDPAHCAYPA